MQAHAHIDTSSASSPRARTSHAGAGIEVLAHSEDRTLGNGGLLMLAALRWARLQGMHDSRDEQHVGECRKGFMRSRASLPSMTLLLTLLTVRVWQICSWARQSFVSSVVHLLLIWRITAILVYTGWLGHMCDWVSCSVCGAKAIFPTAYFDMPSSLEVEVNMRPAEGAWNERTGVVGTDGGCKQTAGTEPGRMGGRGHEAWDQWMKPVRRHQTAHMGR